MWRLILLALLLTGCSSTNISELVKAFAADPNTAGVYVDVGSPWGTQKARLCRSAPGAKVTCGDSGMTVEPVAK